MFSTLLNIYMFYQHFSNFGNGWFADPVQSFAHGALIHPPEGFALERDVLVHDELVIITSARKAFDLRSSENVITDTINSRSS